MISSKIFTIYSSAMPKSHLAEACKRLLVQQKDSWRQCGDGYAALDAVKTRDVECNGYTVRLQFNPQRIVSTAANVDTHAIRQRPCFLCLENLPGEQQGILYRDDFLILCNPAPIFRQHFTITHMKHTPQVLEPHLDVFFKLAEELSPNWSVFYNGPRCGASAPDHMHFQVCPKDAIPVERDARDPRRRRIVFNPGFTAILTLKSYGRSLLVYESTDAIELKVMVRRLLAALQEHEGTSEEPMLNAICTYREGVWRLMVFLRSKHRPEVYFADGDGRILISPAAVDVGGLIVTPVEKDFDRLDAPTIERIFTEVSLPDATMEHIIGTLR